MIVDFPTLVKLLGICLQSYINVVVAPLRQTVCLRILYAELTNADSSLISVEGGNASNIFDS